MYEKLFKTNYTNNLLYPFSTEIAPQSADLKGAPFQSLVLT